MKSYEVNFDGLPGPTHNYSGLAFGNIASMGHKAATSHPKAAALQSLEKMRLLGSRGLIQGVLPPHERPHLPTLRRLGFSGSDAQIITEAARREPEIFVSCCSSSAMWAANSATFTPAVDSSDGHTHITPANLTATLHRSIEAEETHRVLQKLFHDPLYFTLHSPLPPLFHDEGAANHTRLCRQLGAAGIHLFVYGKHSRKSNALAPQRFPARQSAEASHAIARRHTIHPSRLLFAQQQPRAIDAGAFHNDVVAVGHETLFFYHTDAFVNGGAVATDLRDTFAAVCNGELLLLPVAEEEIPLETAVATYMFNSQIVTLPSGAFLLIAPRECHDNGRVHAYLEALANDNTIPIQEVVYTPLNESMHNGGGPACLRLRVVLTEQEVKALGANLLLSQPLYERLVKWVNRHYRDTIEPQELADPLLYEEAKVALNELTHILKLGSHYSFQRADNSL